MARAPPKREIRRGETARLMVIMTKLAPKRRALLVSQPKKRAGVEMAKFVAR